MAKNSHCTGWQYQSGTTLENFSLKPDLRKLTVKVDVPTDSADEELLDTSSQFDDQLCSQLNLNSANNVLLSPLSNRSSYLNSNVVLRELPSRQINFSRVDLTDDSSDRHCPYRRQKPSTLKSQAQKAMMTRHRDDVNASEVIGSMMSNPAMSQAGIEADHIRMETLRDLNCSLTMKRKMKRQIGHEMTNKRKPSVVKSPTLLFKLTRGCRIFSSGVKQMWKKVDMWRNQMMHIEGIYGSSTTYYFRFLQFLICLNLVNFICTTSFVITPQLLLRFFIPPPMNDTLDKELLLAVNYSSISQDQVSRLSQTYSLFQEEQDEYYNQSIKFQWTDLITGSGYLSTTELYYGIYANYSVTITGNQQYNLPLAYILVVIITLLFTLLLLANRVARAYKQHIIMNSGFGVHIYCNLAFCSWDFKIRCKRSAKVKATGILQDFEAKILKLKNEANPMTSKQKAAKCFKHLLIHLIIIVILAITGVLIWSLLQNNILKTGIPILDDMMVPLVITSLLIVIPFAFTLLLNWEKYINETTATYINMIRMMMLLVTVIGVLCYFWFRTNAHEDASVPQNNCWETRLGEEIYKLLLVDFVVVNALFFITTFIRRYFLNRCMGFPEFNLAWNTWNLIYTQMLGWLGTLYMPPISMLVILKLTLTYYIKQVHIRLNCVPPARPWGASLTKTVFLSLAFMGLLFMMAPFSYSVYTMKPSPACGPYKDSENIISVLVLSFQYFSMVDTVFGFIWRIISMPGFVGVLLVILCAIAFQAKSYAKSTKQLRERLKRQVMLEGNDKVFLLNMLDGATKTLELMRIDRNSATSVNQRIFRFSSVNRNLTDLKSPESISNNDNVASQTATTPSNISAHATWHRRDSTSTEQSFITCDNYSPNHTLEETPNIRSTDTTGYKTTAI